MPAEGVRGHLLPGRLAEDKSLGVLISLHHTTATHSPHSVTPGMQLTLPAVSPRGALCLRVSPSGVAAALSLRPFVTCLVQSEKLQPPGCWVTGQKKPLGGPLVIFTDFLSPALR